MKHLTRKGSNTRAARRRQGHGGPGAGIGVERPARLAWLAAVPLLLAAWLWMALSSPQAREPLEPPGALEGGLQKAAARHAPGAGGARPSGAATVSSVTTAAGIEKNARNNLLESAVLRWRSFTRQDGLPSDKVFAVRIDGDRVWAGTENGLALLEDGKWQVFGVADGLPHPVVLALEVSPRTGDLWIATMGGLARWSAGRIDRFTQLNSGLSNDFVHAVRADPERDAVWAATAMGASRLDLRRGEWTIFTEQNTPMHEPWPYSIAFGAGRVYVGAWGAGVLEYDPETGRWREFRDPDGEMEIDLFPDDGPVHDVTASVDFDDGILWQATYFGVSRYDGRHWRSYFKQDSGLASDFINFVRARGRTAWLCTDDGLSVTDGERWVTYRRLDDGRGEIVWQRGNKRLVRKTAPSAIAHNFVLGVDTADGAVWVATAAGISHGSLQPLPPEVSRRLSGPDAEEKPQRSAASAEEPFRYARTPDELRPYRGLRAYRDFYTTRPEYRGSGRDKTLESLPEEVRIGFIGPLDERDLSEVPEGFRAALPGNPKAAFGRAMLRGARMAVDEANTGGGYEGRPFRLIVRTDLVLWGQTSNELVKFAYQDAVWAILTGMESNHNHVLARASLKAEVPIVNAGSSDPTLVEHAIPWMSRVVNDDRQNTYLLLDYMHRIYGLRRPALLRVNDRDGRVGVEEFVQGARRLGAPVVIEQRFNTGDTDFRDILERIAGAEPDALVLWGNPREAGQIVRQLRDMGLEYPVFGFDRLVHPEFLRAAGPQAEGIVAVATFRPDDADPSWRTFRQHYLERFGEEPDAYAAHGYDGMAVLIAAIREAGLNRARIRDALYALDTVRGVTGTITFDTNMNDVGTPWLAVVRGGRFRYFRADSEDMARGTRPREVAEQRATERQVR